MSGPHARASAAHRGTLGASAILIVVVLGACGGDPYAAVRKVLPPHADSVARQFITFARASDIASAESLVAPGSRGPQTHVGLFTFASVMGPVAPDTLRAVSVETFGRAGDGRVVVTYELAYPDRWVLARIAMRDSSGTTALIGARADGIPRRVAAINALTLSGRPAWAWGIALLVVVVPLFILVTAVQLVRGRLPGRWFWAMVTLVGVGRYSIDWTTGASAFAPAHVVLLGASVVRAGGPYVPWMISIALPIGAIAAQIYMYRMRRRAHRAPG